VHVSKTAEEPNAAWPTTPELELSYTTSLLEVLLWLPITSDRQELVESLFTLLKCSQSGTWPSSASKSKMTEISGDEKEKSKTVNLDYVQQLILMALERVIALSHFQGGEQEVMVMDLDTVKVDITAVVQCVAEASDVALRNQALTLLTAISRVSPDLVLKHVIDILTAIGASTITQNDNYSHEVAQQTLVAVVPCWLTTKEDPTTLLQVVITALPQVPAHRRMAIVTTLLRYTTGHVAH
jgi:U3 small nucleolar RNA-associated protein 10